MKKNYFTIKKSFKEKFLILNSKFFIIISVAVFMFGCASESSSFDGATSETGIGGSMARFAVVGDYLYTVNNESMKIFNITDETNPYYSSDKSIGFGIETIFPLDTLLYIGSTSGMDIYSIANPADPEFISNYWHITSCDPVVVDSTFAYLTLHTNEITETTNRWGWGRNCNNGVNELHIIDISDIYYPQQVAQYDMIRPLGLGTDDNKLFLCDDGLKVYDIGNTPEINLLQHFDISANDVIPLGEILLVVGNDGLYQYNYSGETLDFISKLETCSGNIIP